MSKSASNARRLRRASERVRHALASLMSLSPPDVPDVGRREAWLCWAGRAGQLVRLAEARRELTQWEASLSEALRDLDAHIAPLDEAGFLSAWEEAVVSRVMDL